MPTLLRYVAAFVAAVMCTALLASVFSTQSVIASLQEVGANVSFNTRLSMTLSDFKVLETLGAVTAACFLVGFLVAYACNRFVLQSRIAWFTLAGACALVSTLLLMSWFLQLAPIAGARTLLGLTFQGFSGACGGFIFAKLTSSSESSKGSLV